MRTYYLKNLFLPSKDELISIFNYIKNLDHNILENHKENIKGINIFLTANEQLINFSGKKFARYPPELKSLREYLPFSMIDKELLDTVKELLEELDIFVTISPKHIFNILITDFQTQKFPLDLRNSKPYLNSTAYLIKIINFLDPGLRILQHIKKGQQIPKDLIVKFEKF